MASLKALQALKVPNMGQVMKVAVADSNADVRRAALGILPTLAMSDAAKVESLVAVIRGGAVNDQQAGFAALGTLKSAEAEKALSSFFEELAAGKLRRRSSSTSSMRCRPTGRVPDGEARGLPEIEVGADSCRGIRDALLQGGSARRGQDASIEGPAAQCTRCHTVRNAGSDVGPNLTGVAQRLTRDRDSRVAARPERTHRAWLRNGCHYPQDGQRVDGTLKEETATDVVLSAGTPPADRRIAKAEIAERTNAVSAMPPMGLILKPREVRDIVAYLSTLR